jgi:PAS fold
VIGLSADWTGPETRDANIRPDASVYTDDDRTKSKKQLLEELVELRQPVKPSRRATTRTQSKLARDYGSFSPLARQASGDCRCTFVSENLRAIMGYSPEEMTTDPKTWATHLHPEDAPRVFKEMGPLIERGGGTV